MRLKNISTRGLRINDVEVEIGASVDVEKEVRVMYKNLNFKFEITSPVLLV